MASPDLLGDLWRNAATEAVRDALRAVIDPEIGVDIVELGLVIDVAVEGEDVTVTMTTTSPVCPLGELMRLQAEEAIVQQVPGVGQVDVQMVHTPPWSPDWMSPAARALLGLDDVGR